MSAAETLRRARSRIEQPERWTRWVLARDCAGSGVKPEDPAAICWCAMGALDAEDAPASAYLTLREVARPFVKPGSDIVPAFNDALTTMHDDVLALFDLAIEMTEKEGS